MKEPTIESLRYENRKIKDDNEALKKENEALKNEIEWLKNDSKVLDGMNNKTMLENKRYKKIVETITKLCEIGLDI